MKLSHQTLGLSPDESSKLVWRWCLRIAGWN